jgi:hypothetical protein
MQTFLTFESFKETAESLDSKRLNKQRVEALQIYKSLTGQYESGAWQNHPATRMWRGAEALLCLYAIKICNECDRRGFADNTGMLDKFYDQMNRHLFYVPMWWVNRAQRDRIIYTHRCNLLRKDYNYYKDIFPDVRPEDIFTTSYAWPIP